MIEVRDIDVRNDLEAGLVMTFTCPKCGSRISIATLGWWDPICDCDYYWRAEWGYAFTTDDEKESE
jgi:hypothetical protein